MPDEPEPSPSLPRPAGCDGADAAAAEAAARKVKACDDEFTRYEKHRSDLTKAELDAEKSFDTVLVSLSSLGIATSFTILKDVTKGQGAAFIFLSWAMLGACLVLSLVDRLYTYKTHKQWREKFDEEFNNWSEGAWRRAQDAYMALPFVEWLPRLKGIGSVLLIFGILFLMLAVFAGWQATSSATVPALQTSPPISVNVYNVPGTQPVAIPPATKSP